MLFTTNKQNLHGHNSYKTLRNMVPGIEMAL